MQLYNKINGNELKESIRKNPGSRRTLSFYKYHLLGNPGLFRDHLYLLLEPIGVLGRIYVAHEGINAQISIPVNKLNEFSSALKDILFLRDIRLNLAVEEHNISFYKLKIKVKDKILADGLTDGTFDVTNTGRHLNAREFNRLTDNPETLIVDMRNHYESEVGHFRGALNFDTDTFRETLRKASRELVPYREKPIVMYCTGGIRCEKASAYFKHMGFKYVYQLEGGIIKYTHDASECGLENKFIGKNFVFDDRLGERISDDILARCHQCGKPCDTHINCRNVACNLLFIQCEECSASYEGCCSVSCREVIHLSEEEQKRLRKGNDSGIRIFTKGR